MGAKSVNGDLAKAMTLLLTPEQGISPVLNRNSRNTEIPAYQPDASLVTQRSNKEKLRILRLRSEASRKLQKLPPKAVTESGNEQAGGHIFDLDDDAEDLMSQENFRIKSAQSMPIALQGAPDAAVRDVCSHGAERSMHSSSSTGSREHLKQESIDRERSFEDPAWAIDSVLKTLAQANASQRVDLDWEAQNQALADIRHLTEHHSRFVAKGVTTLVAAVVPAVDALRSQTAHAALLALQVIVEKLGGGADSAAEAIVAAAARRSGEISRGGRESSLSAAADALLSAAVRFLSPSKVAVALLAHLDDRNQHTRSRIAAHLCTCITKSSSYFAQPGADAIQGSVFKAALACMEAGSPRTRASGRMLLLELHNKIMEPARFRGLLNRLHSQSQHMKVKEVLAVLRS